MQGGGGAGLVRPRRRGSRLGATLLAGLIAGAALCAAPAAAAVSSTTAYWWMPEPVTGLIRVPGVPPGGMYVASSPSGPQAISALRTADGLVGGVVQVTLRVAQRQVVNAPSIAAYHVTSSWQPGGPQAWSSKPGYDGTKPIALGRFDMAQTTMTLDLPSDALSSGIALVPAPTPGASVSATFAIAFAAPTAADVRLFPGPTTRPTRSVLPTHSPGHSPSTSPRATRHRGDASPSPSARTTHAHRTHSPSARPTRPPPRPNPRANAATTSSGHGVRDLIIVLVVIAAIGIPVTVVALGRRQGSRTDPPNQ